MKMSDSIKELATALALAQREMKKAPKAAENPFYKSKYADLAGVWDAAREPLTKHGLSIVQLPGTTGDGKLSLETMLVHSSGEYISETVIMKPVREKKGEGFVPAEDPQAIGSAISYARRYGLAAICGVATEDDDGNAGSGKTGYTVRKEEDGDTDPAILSTIENAKTMDELAAAWNKIPVNVRRSYSAAKDSAKQRIAGAAA